MSAETSSAIAAAFTDPQDLAIAKIAMGALAKFPRNIGERNCGGVTWNEHSKKDKLTVYSSEVSGSSLKAFKAVYDYLPYPLETVRSHVIEPALRKTWDSALSDFGRTIIGPVNLPLPLKVSDCEKAPPGSEYPTKVQEAVVSVIRSTTKAAFAVSAREFVDCSVTFEDTEGGIWSTCGGIESEDGRFPEVKGLVRGQNSQGFTGWCLEPVKDASGNVVGTRFLYFVHTDVKGWIPKAAVNHAVASNFANFFAELEAHLSAKK